jgi:hypothetical protein
MGMIVFLVSRSRLYSNVFLSLVFITVRSNAYVCFVANAPRSCSNCDKQQQFALFVMGRAQKKQIELAQKFENAKQQLQQNQSIQNCRTNTSNDGGAETIRCVNATNTEIQQRQTARSEFSMLLPKYKPPVNVEDLSVSSQRPVAYKPQNSAKKSGNMKKTQIEGQTKIASYDEEVEFLSDIDNDQSRPVSTIARRIHFESLINVRTKQPLGPIGAATLVPWVPPYLYRYILILVDPRKQSTEWRTALQYIESNQRKDSCNIIAITADTCDDIDAYVCTLTLWEVP